MSSNPQPAAQPAPLEAMRRHARACADLAGCARRQEALIERGDAEELLQLLAQRQALIDEIMAARQRLAGFDGSAAAESASLAREAEVHLAEVATIDRRAGSHLEERLRRLGADLSESGAARSARRAYTPSPSLVAGGSTTRYTDQCG